MPDLASLVISVDSTPADRATRSLDQMAAAGKRAETATAMLGRALAAIGAGLLAKAFWDVNVQFQRLQASLVTVTGSTERAGAAFERLKRFATETPYELSEVTQAFIQLKTRGMDAGSASLRAFGDMASSFGRSITDTIQAVAQATVGEFESIKSFGVVSRDLGDRIAFTFKNQTEVVKKSASDIENYFQRLASSNFGGGMERQMKTLGGAFSNLKDQIASTFFTIGESGVNEKLISSIKAITEALARATPMLAQFGEFAASSMATALDAVYRFRVALLALLAVAVAPVVTAWVASMGAYVTVATGAALRTVALTYSISGYSVGATAAALASQGLAAAWGLMTSAAGMLAIGLAALYLATKGIRDETERLNAAHAEFEERMAKTVTPIMDLKDRTRELKEETKQLEAAMNGGKAVRLFGQEAKQVVDLIRKNGGDVGWAKKVAADFDDAAKANKAVKDKLVLKAEAEKKAAEEAKRHAEELRKLGKELAFEVATQGFSTQEMEKAKVARLGATGAVRAHIFALLDQKAAYESELRVREELKALDAETFQNNLNIASARLDAAKAIRDSLNPMADYQAKLKEIDLLAKNGFLTPEEKLGAERKAWEDLTEAGQKYLDIKREAKGLADEVATPEERRAKDIEKLNIMLRGGLISAESYRRKLLEIETTGAGTFATLAEAMKATTQTMEDAFVRFATTGKFSFRDMANSIMQDLARIYAQKAFQQLLSWGINALMPASPGLAAASATGNTIGAAISGARASGGPVGAGQAYLVGERGPEVFVPPTNGNIVPNNAIGGSMSVVVNVDASGSVSTEGGGAGINGKALGALVGAKVREVLVNEKRPGGLLMATR